MRTRWHFVVLPAALLAILAGCSGGGGDAQGAPAAHGARDAGSEGRPGASGRPGGEPGSGASRQGSGRPGGPPSGGGHGRPGGGGWGGPPGAGETAAAVPVETTTVTRRAISSYIETNGTLEAENEVDLVARITGPIVELRVEEGDRVRRGDLLAKIDDRELKSRAEVSKAALAEAEKDWERSKSLLDSALISPQAWGQAVSRFETAKAQYEADVILLGYTEIRAPFDALVVVRHVNFAEHVAVNAPLFRVSDFEPLLCPIQIPEKDLARVKVGQGAYLTLEAWPERRFRARVDRIRPVVDAATGTVRVTLAVATEGVLRPGMFARVFLEIDRRDGALVIPKAALSLESIGDTVYVASGTLAERREVVLGFREGDSVEVTRGLAEGEQVVVVGQDGLSDGTPIQVLAALDPPPSVPSGPSTPSMSSIPAASDSGTRPPDRSGAGRPSDPQRSGEGSSAPPGGFDPSQMTPERLEMIKERMRQRGLTDEQIEERLQRFRERSGG